MIPAISYMIASLGTTICLYIMYRVADDASSEKAVRGIFAAIIMMIAVLTIGVLIFQALAIHEASQPDPLRDFLR